MWRTTLSTRHLFFTGKGGVGKTSLACATALRLARSGKRTLLVSTDPASNIDEVFGVKLGTSPTPVPGVANLQAANLDPEAAAASYREKIVGPFRGKLPEAVVRSMEEQFSGACTTEIAAFDEFVTLLGDPKATGEFDHIVFDTAPTGHTLRLLSLPGAWSGYLNTTTAEASCLGPLAGLQDQRALYEQAFAELRSAKSTTLILVARAEASSLKEAARTLEELRDIGVENLQLIVNAVFRADSADDPIACALVERTERALAGMPQALGTIPSSEVPLMSIDMVGLPALEALLSESPPDVHETFPGSAPLTGERLESLVDEIRAVGHGVVMTMGKGGVGKTRVAALIARLLAKAGEKVLLTTTDPAGNVGDEVAPAGNLEVEQIDAVTATARHTERVLAKASETMDEEGLALLREDLRSPCTEEVAIFRAFADAVERATDGFVVIDTAPTGHTILLMDATEAYHREVARTESDAPESVRELLPRLRDPSFTRVVLVTLPEPTPVHEAARLQADLRRAGIEPFAWVVNRSLRAAEVSSPLLAARAAREAGPIQEVSLLSRRMVVLPWSASEAESAPAASAGVN